MNSLIGYLGGAELLIQFANRLRGTDAVRRGALGHISGDEFLLVVDRFPSGKAEARLAARAIKDVLKKPFTVRGRSIRVTVSIGISIYPDDARTVGELFEHATNAGLRAKRAGKSCYRMFRGSGGVG